MRDDEGLSQSGGSQREAAHTIRLVSLHDIHLSRVGDALAAQGQGVDAVCVC